MRAMILTQIASLAERPDPNSLSYRGTRSYPLEQANRALRELRTGGARGAKVLVV